ncbi:MAG: hypothetical protein AVDCRST_MAG93-4769 [uncultured Chloroflexia bacterium]|uniref:Uncharacterized protein n=1 Tax=uncultured Chloroflexia bacterium TaxID=1672391 RepID=A0A6J4KFH0_9CHLR|nr:MAG: hypothetical protein AVDCRST_MAG93-4769 [uncultured Chloroflexia bacterium]
MLDDWQWVQRFCLLVDIMPKAEDATIVLGELKRRRLVHSGGDFYFCCCSVERGE